MNNWCQKGGEISVVSEITGRVIVLNSSPDKFLILENDFDNIKVMEALSKTRELWLGMAPGIRPTLAMRGLLSEWDSIADTETFERVLRCLFEYAASLPALLKKDRRADRSRIRDLLVALWSSDLLLWPRSVVADGPLKSVPLNHDVECWPEQSRTIIQEVTLAMKTKSDTERMAYSARFGRILLARQGVCEIGDLSPAVIAGDLFDAGSRKHLMAGLIAALRRRYGSEVAHWAPKDFGHVGRIATRSDDNFNWVTEEDSSLVAWCESGSGWMGQQHVAVDTRRGALNSFFKYLVANPNVPRDPLIYLGREYALNVEVESVTPRYRNYIAEFMDWILLVRCTVEDDHGHPVRVPGFRNPIVRVGGLCSNRGETHREAMPTKLVRMLIEILTEDNFAWPKKAGCSVKGGDYFRRWNSEVDAYESIWSPVRAYALLTKLMLPLRTYQVRVLDSGEADTSVWLPSGGWKKNDSLLAEPDTERGVFRRDADTTGINRTFLYINTNKTQDRGKAADDAGYVMPWENRQVLGLLAELRDWQNHNNPLVRPTRWSEIDETRIAGRKSKKELTRLGASCFLFRDPCSDYPDQPISEFRLVNFWKLLQVELERRLINAGEVGPDGRPILLVQRKLSSTGDMTALGACTYDLHSLRVTMITALADAGVDPQILMKVVGHSTVIMTLYYRKISPTHISEQLNEAQQKLEKTEQANWLRWIADKSANVIISAAAFNDPVGPDTIAEGRSSSWLVRDHGICPVAGNRCHEGGDKVVEQSSGWIKFGPVLGGSSNCVRCRFFVTGPAFLMGLTTAFNAIGFNLRESSRRYQTAKATRDELEHACNMARSNSEPITCMPELDRATAQMDVATEAVDGLAQSWHAAYRLIQQSLHLLRAGQGKQSLALMTNGSGHDVATIIEDSTEFELADAVCQSAAFYRDIDSTVPNLRRLRMFDAMLRKGGINPVFIEMSDEDALRIGNEMARFLYLRRGRTEINALLAGRTTLERLGLTNEVASRLDQLVHLKIMARKSSDSTALIGI